MRQPASLAIETLVLPGLNSRAAEQVAADLHGQLAALEEADLARGLVWRQPDHAVDLTLDCRPDGGIDTAAMAAAIRAHFVTPEQGA